MAGPTYTARIIVLRKTKLKESDLIYTLLAGDGSQIRAVAKGARKPRSPFASRLELFNAADVLLAQGRSLDILKEARLVRAGRNLLASPEHASGAACVAELAEQLTQPGLAVERLFDMTEAALSALDAAPAGAVPSLSAAYILKAHAQTGTRPVFGACAACGRPLDADAAPALRFSPSEGGMLCDACSGAADVKRVDAHALAWAQALLMGTFERIAAAPAPPAAAYSVLELAQDWCACHAGRPLRSVRYLLTAPLSLS